MLAAPSLQYPLYNKEMTLPLHEGHLTKLQSQVIFLGLTTERVDTVQ